MILNTKNFFNALAKIGFILAVNSASYAQEAPLSQPSKPFPFDVVLHTPDSVAYNSTYIFGTEKKVTVLAFWLTTCGPCAVELDAFSQHYYDWIERYNVRLLAISMDFPEQFSDIRRRLDQKYYPFPVWWDGTRSFKELLPGRLNGMPQVFVFDPEGRLVWQHKGYRTGDESKLEQQIQAASK
jgi:cytochrome c biogenesis protein CcmG, thiol:disulfide interchange protein DsbE